MSFENEPIGQKKDESPSPGHTNEEPFEERKISSAKSTTPRSMLNLEPINENKLEEDNVLLQE